MKRRIPITVSHARSAAHGEGRGISQASPYEGGHPGKQFFRIAGAAGYTCLLLVTLALTSVPPAGAQPVCVPQFSDWSEPINLCYVNNPAGIRCEVNWGGNDQGPAISKDELELYFVRELNGDRDPDPGDIWVSTREHKRDPWGAPQNLGANINTRPTLFTNDDPRMPINGRENLPTLSRDGLRLYFSSNRPRPLPGGGVTTDFDMWVSERSDRRDPLGWGPPVNLGIGFNTNGGQELGPVPFEDPLTETFTLYFYAIRPGTGARDLFTSTLDENGVFTPHPIADLNTSCNDEQPSIRRDGLELFFTSNRSVVNPMMCLPPNASDIWVSTRASTSDPWSLPVNLGSPINTAKLEARPALSFDGRSLYFFSDRLGGSGATDLWVSTRTKLDDCDDGDDDD
jgi:WD40 repeat protein